MEPRSFKRGNIVTARVIAANRLLQWSHVLSNVETRARVVEVSHLLIASMEPRSFKRGNVSSPPGVVPDK